MFDAGYKDALLKVGLSLEKMTQTWQRGARDLPLQELLRKAPRLGDLVSRGHLTARNVVSANPNMAQTSAVIRRLGFGG